MDPTTGFLHALTWGLVVAGVLLSVTVGLRTLALLTRWRPLTTLTGRTPRLVLLTIDTALVILFPRLALADPGGPPVRQWLEQAPVAIAPPPANPAPDAAAPPPGAPATSEPAVPPPSSSARAPAEGGDRPAGGGPPAPQNTDGAAAGPREPARTPDGPKGGPSAPGRGPVTPGPAAGPAAAGDDRTTEDTPPPTPAPGAVATAPGEPTAAPPPGVYVVRQGDCLWRIAARHLGAGATPAEIDLAWRHIYDANRAVIGPDPDLLLPGQQLLVAGAGGAR